MSVAENSVRNDSPKTVRQPRRQTVDLEQIDRDVGLDRGEQKQQNERKAQTEDQRQRVAQDLLGRSGGKAAELHACASFTSLMKASSNFSAPA